MKLPLKALAAFAVALATTASMAEDQPAAADCARQPPGTATTPCATPHADRSLAQFDAVAKREATRDDPAVATKSPRLEHRIARYATTARPPTNGAVLADGVTIDGGQ
ncbi:MAG TPA: hypothetical protein VNU21_17995 [Usitatibacter sp.]|jgi:hypothetical protein|nr:hypothetical protein [Usitatibacter sp.]